MNGKTGFLTRERLTSIAANEGINPAAVVDLALDLFLLSPRSVRQQVASMQSLPLHVRRRAYSELNDALTRGEEIAIQMEQRR